MTATDQHLGATGRALAPGFVLAVDTCGPSGSVALARCGAEGVSVLDQMELAGKSYSATLIIAIEALLKKGGIGIEELSAIVVVNGPGSFTGVRVGVSAVKGLVE